MSVVLRHCCENFIYPTSYVLHYSNIYKKRCQTDLDAYCREMNGTDADLAAHFTVTRAVGITLCGEMCIRDRRSTARTASVIKPLPQCSLPKA